MNRTAVIIAAIAIAFGFVGGMDYDAARVQECQRLGLDYNRKADQCFCPKEVCHVPGN